MPPALPILLDTDVGTDVDDAIAIALLLASPELDARAVTTVSGDTVLRARIAQRLLALGGHADVPVAAGIREPVLRQRSFVWVGHEGQGIVDSAGPAGMAQVSSLHAVDLLIETVLRQRPHVIAIGPLSNLAVAIMKEPAVIDAIPHLTIMGGSFGRDPRLPMFEYNLCGDAEASMVILQAGIPVTLVPLEVTHRVFFSAAHLSRLRRSGSVLVQVLCDAIELWAPIQQALFGSAPFCSPDVMTFLHDPLTVAVLIDPTLVTWERVPLRPAIVDGQFRLLEDAAGTGFRVAVAVDAPRVLEWILARLESLA